MARQAPVYGPRFDPEDTVEFKFHCTKKMRQQIRDLANALHISNAAVVVLAVKSELERQEEKIRIEQEREERLKDERRDKRRALAAPTPLPIAPGTIERLDPSFADENVPLDKLYEEHARRIAEALDGDVRELRLRRDEAVTAIKKQNPLTHPPEEEIVAKLEKLALKIKPTLKSKEPPKPETVDSDDEDVITIK